MTCIVGIAYEGKVMLGADSAGVGGLDLRVRGPNAKLVRNGNLIFGATTSFRMIDILQHALTVPKVFEGQKPIDYVVQSLIPAVRHAFKDGGFAKIESGRESGGTFLVGFRGQLFTVYDDYQVAFDANDIASVGCGDAYAMGAMHSVRGFITDPMLRLATGLNAAETFSAGVRGPFHYITLEPEKTP